MVQLIPRDPRKPKIIFGVARRGTVLSGGDCDLWVDPARGRARANAPGQSPIFPYEIRSLTLAIPFEQPEKIAFRKFAPDPEQRPVELDDRRQPAAVPDHGVMLVKPDFHGPRDADQLQACDEMHLAFVLDRPAIVDADGDKT